MPVDNSAASETPAALGRTVSGLITRAADGPYFLDPDGRPFFLLGVNYEGYYDRAWKMWEDEFFDPALIEKDFGKMRDVGFNTARLFLQSALIQDVARGDFTKLDTVIDLARQYGLYLLFTLNDWHDHELADVTRIDSVVAQHLAGESIVLGYDLENEPGFYTFASATYPQEHPALLQSLAIIEHYGAKMSQSEVDAWRQSGAGRRTVPSRFDSLQGYYYANAYLYYLDFLRAAGDWVRQHGGTTLDYMDSDDSAYWQPFLQVLDGTVAAWLATRMEPLRAADPHQLLTVGYNNFVMAKLPANAALDFQSFHRYSTQSWWGLNTTTKLLDNLAASFAGQPFTLGEFGFSNDDGTSRDRSQPVDQALTAVGETALYLYLRSKGAGGYKWMLNDAWDLNNPREGAFGVFEADDKPKVIAHALKKLAAYWARSTAQGTFTLLVDRRTTAGYRYVASDALFLGGSLYKGDEATFEPVKPGQLFVTWSAADVLTVESTVDGQVGLNPAQLIANWPAEMGVGIYRQGAGGSRVKLGEAPPGMATFQVKTGHTYVLAAEDVAIEPVPPSSPTVWYFAEGTTQPPFDELWMVLMNPQSHSVEARLTFMREGASPVVRHYTLQPTSQFPLLVNDVVPNAAISTKVEADYPIYAERTMYFGHGGHTSRGVAAPAKAWYLTEGYTGPGFDTWVLLQNPGQAAAQAVVTFFKDDGSQVRRDFTLPPTSRTSIFVDQIVPNAAVATRVEADRPIIAERAMYFGDGGGHGTVGVSEPSKVWYLTEGYTGPGYDTWILLMNPNDVLANVTVYLLKEDGEVVPHHVQMRPTSRYTLHANDVVPNVAFGTRIESDQPIAAERAQYFANGRGGHCSIGAPAPARIWNLPEGSTVGDTNTFILIMNPGWGWPRLKVTFMKEDGRTVVRDYAIRPHSRLTIHVNNVVPGARLSTRIESNQPVVAERAMYVHGGLGGTASVGIPEE